METIRASSVYWRPRIGSRILEAAGPGRTRTGAPARPFHEAQNGLEGPRNAAARAPPALGGRRPLRARTPERPGLARTHRRPGRADARRRPRLPRGGAGGDVRRA